MVSDETFPIPSDNSLFIFEMWIRSYFSYSNHADFTGPSLRHNTSPSRLPLCGVITHITLPLVIPSHAGLAHLLLLIFTSWGVEGEGAEGGKRKEEGKRRERGRWRGRRRRIKGGGGEEGEGEEEIRGEEEKEEIKKTVKTDHLSGTSEDLWIQRMFLNLN